MMGGTPAEHGETVASFPAYEGAQKAVSALIEAEIPAKQVHIVGRGLRSVETITGRLGYASAARSGAVNGILLGLFFSAFTVLGNPGAPIQLFIGVMFVGVAVGMIFALLLHTLLRRRRTFASVTQVVADHYDVTVTAEGIARAREVLGKKTAPASAATRAPDLSQPPRYGERVDPLPPPKYGERVDAPPPPPSAPPAQVPADGADLPAGEAPRDQPLAPPSGDAAPPAEPTPVAPIDDAPEGAEPPVAPEGSDPAPER